jgi:hypothetical protein
VIPKSVSALFTSSEQVGRGRVLGRMAKRDHGEQSFHGLGLAAVFRIMIRRNMLLASISATVVLGASERCSLGQTQYTKDGEPSGIEEEIRWRVNRGRFDSVSENLARGTAYSDVPASSGPLAPNQSLTLAARHHSEDMAKNNDFQHETVIGSAYYDPVTQSQPWDRMEAEGYSWNQAAENIAAGYSGGETVYTGWWNSTGHRTGMYQSGLREIGDGNFFWAGSTYQRYYTMDLGSSGTAAFFTDTLFKDATGNGTYEQGEGVPNVAIRLLVGGAVQGYFDSSSSVGSFAIPIQNIASGLVAQVTFSNTTTLTIALSVPLSYSNSTSVTLAPRESRVYGQFTKPSGSRNVGLRQVAPMVVPIVPPSLSMEARAEGVVVQWPSDLALEYQLQRSIDAVAWIPLTQNFQPGIAGTMSYVETPGPGPKFFRLAVRRH